MSNLEQLTARWEDQREIKNLMGKFANSQLMNWDDRIFPEFWSREPDVALGFNDGWYRGREAVKGYYAACEERCRLVTRLIMKKFPEKVKGETEESLKGTGPMRIDPMGTPVIEIAEDRKTAKGLWSCFGSNNIVESCGPAAHWNWGYYAVDYIREEDGWRIWHMQVLRDIDSLCGQSWGKPQVPFPDVEEFLPLKDFRYPEYTEKVCVRELYDPRRRHWESPRIPEPYTIFADTFSYAV